MPPLPYRILGGLLIFTFLAIQDLRKNGPAATRWREYLFLLLCVAVALLYGILNDQISVTISWEYFYYGKDLQSSLGIKTPPDPIPLRLGAAKIGMMATWSVGLLMGVLLLIANNPFKHYPQLRYRALFSNLLLILAITIPFAATGSILGYLGLLDFLSQDFIDLRHDDMWRPAHFTAAWGEHLGSYAGGLIGLTAACARTVYLRKRAALTDSVARLDQTANVS